MWINKSYSYFLIAKKMPFLAKKKYKTTEKKKYHNSHVKYHSALKSKFYLNS